MKKLLITAVVTGFAIAALLGGNASAAKLGENYDGANGCKVTTSLPKKGTPMPGKNSTKFSRADGRAYINVKAEGAKCNEEVSLATWKTPSADGRPYNQQELAWSKTVTLKGGSRTMSIGIPKNGCFFQIDLVFGGPTDPKGGPFYEKGRLINAVKGGSKDCVTEPEPDKIRVCELATKEVIVIAENAFNANLHTRDLTKCEDKTVEPDTIEVCEIATKRIIEIKEDEFDATKHTTDRSQCATAPVVPGTPTPTTPVSLPKTGPASVIAVFIAVTAVATAGYTLFARRATRA